VAFREVRMFEIREMLRLWLRGEGLRSIAGLAGMDRKTVRRYVEAAGELGLDRAGGEGQLTDLFLGRVVERVRPHRTDGRGEAWRVLDGHRDQLKTWLTDQQLTVVKVHELLERCGVVVPERTLHRYALEELGVGRSARSSTVRVNDGAPGDELQVDFGKLGRIPDPETGRQRDCWALVFTPVVSRFGFVWLTHRQTTEDVIAGFEAAWAFFDGIFATVIPDNLKAVVDRSDALEPRFNQAFVEYAQTRGFVIDPARVRRPQDKPRVERVVPFVRNSFFAGESFIDLADTQPRAEVWCRGRAGMRIHGTTQLRPAEAFRVEELPALAPPPAAPYDLPIYATAKVHRDHHIEVARALYSIPGNLIGTRVEVRADRNLVKVFSRGQLVKIHPRQAPGGRSTDPADLPSDKTIYAMRDLDRLQRLAASHGPAIGAYATALLDIPLPWTKMRQVYALLGLVTKWGADRVNAACERALAAEAVSVPLIGRMLERGTETGDGVTVQPPLPATVAIPRFARDDSHFVIRAASDTQEVAG
jgi:hypothetical protein